MKGRMYSDINVFEMLCKYICVFGEKKYCGVFRVKIWKVNWVHLSSKRALFPFCLMIVSLTLPERGVKRFLALRGIICVKGICPHDWSFILKSQRTYNYSLEMLTFLCNVKVLKLGEGE